jgi:hypothetical protein
VIVYNADSAQRPSLRAALATMEPLDEELPIIEDSLPEPVHL